MQIVEKMAEGQWPERRHRTRGRETAERVGLVATQDTLQRGVKREATRTSMPLMTMRAKSLKKHLTMMKSCKRGVGWKKMKMSSGKR